MSSHSILKYTNDSRTNFFRDLEIDLIDRKLTNLHIYKYPSMSIATATQTMDDARIAGVSR